MTRLTVSVVVLTYNRKECVDELLHHLRALDEHVLETIVVDNGSGDGTDELIRTNHPGVVYVRSEENLGACGRNLGMERARADLVVTLDDDIFGLTPADLDAIRESFAGNPALVALNFQVRDAVTGGVCNWVHHRTAADAALEFETYEITEGAVAFRRSALEETGGYWEKFFIGHEGPDLAFRLMDAGGEVRYDGRIVVQHKHESTARLNWRFYYFDTRNQIWLAARRMHALQAFRYLAVGLGAMGFYSVRDGFIGWWLRALMHGVRDLREVLRTRRPMSEATRARVRAIDRHRPSFWAQARKRLLQPANRLEG